MARGALLIDNFATCKIMTERHHYVPISLQRNFARNDKIWLFDKHQKRRIRTHIKNAFVEGDYNTVRGAEFFVKGEYFFGEPEARASPIINDILQKRSVEHLTAEQKNSLAIFVAIQHLRSKQIRRTFSYFREYMQKTFPGIPQTPTSIPGFTNIESDKYSSLDFVVKNVTPVADLLLQKHLILIECYSSEGFWLSDHPVILNNDNPPKLHQSNYGLACEGIQIYLPISTHVAVAYFCPTLLKELEDGASKVHRAKSNVFAALFKGGLAGFHSEMILADMSAKARQIERVLNELKGRRIVFKKENLIFINARQVQSSFRFVANEHGDFSLASDILRQSPQFEVPDLYQVVT